MPRVTACVSCLNQPELLRDTLNSIRNQSFKDWECIVVDDGSNVPIKPIVDALKDERFTFHRFPVNKGIPFGANWAYEHAKGDYIQTLGCDECISPTKFEDQVKYLDEHPDVDCIWGVPGEGPMGPVPEWEQVKRRAHNRSREHWIKCFVNLEGIPIGGASALWRRDLFDSIGYFDEKLTAFSDHEWFCRLFEKHEGRILPYRWMWEVPGHKTVCTRTPENAAKLDAELAYVREKHPLIIPPVDGLITLAMPVHNHARFLKQAIDCALAQTDQNFEILVWDDGSTDNPEEVVKTFTDPRIQFFRSEENQGCWNTINKLLDRSRGDFFVVLAADDTTEPTILEKCRAEFKRDPFLEFVSTQNDFMSVENAELEPTYHIFRQIPKAINMNIESWWETLRHGNLYFGLGMYRTKAVREVGGWEQQYKVLADYQMYLKLLPRYTPRIVEEPLIHTRIHGNNMSLLKMGEAKKLKHRYFAAQVPFYQPRPKIVIATPFYELKGFSPYIASLAAVIRMLDHHQIGWEFMELSGDSYVSRARNSMCMTFLEDPYNTDLFFIDSDMAWDPRAFLEIIFRPEPIIGGTYPVKNKWDLWTSKPRIFGGPTDPHFKGVPINEKVHLIEANQLAGGFLRIKRSVLERFIEYYPTHNYRDSHPIPEQRQDQVEFFTAGVDREPEIMLLKDIEQMMNDQNGNGVDLKPLKERFEALKKPREFIGEDYSFSNRLRAMGVQLFIYPNATISHYGVQGWTGNFTEWLEKKQAELRNPEPPSEKTHRIGPMPGTPIL